MCRWQRERRIWGGGGRGWGEIILYLKVTEEESGARRSELRRILNPAWALGSAAVDKMTLAWGGGPGGLDKKAGSAGGPRGALSLGPGKDGAQQKAF